MLGNIYLYYYGIELRQRPSVHTMMIGSDRKRKPLPFTRMVGLGGLGINLVTMSKLIDKQFVLILRRGDAESNTKGELRPCCGS